MKKRKQDPSKAQLGSPEIEGQGTTSAETGKIAKSSSRKSTKKPLQ